ncbi:MAG: MFS transporter [Deltaproteobacteria bacterium]|nr:MFS transporter [Deltaproteobacteria bacterium]
MKISPITYYALAAIFQASGALGAATLAPFFMKEQGYSVAMAGIPLVMNGIGRISSDLLSGVLATYFSSGMLLIAAVIIGLVASLWGIFVLDLMAAFLATWAVLGLTEAMFSLYLRKIAFDQSLPGQQGRAQGQIAAALGIGFTLGPALGGIVGARWGVNALFIVYALPQAAALLFIVLAGAQRVSKPTVSGSVVLWREGRDLLRRPQFLAACLAIFQAFLFLVGVTRVAFPFLAVARAGLTLDMVGTIVSLSRLADTFGRLTGGWLCDRMGTARVILLGVLIGVPMFAIEIYGSDFLTLLIPLSIMTMGFGFTNVGSTTCALQSAGDAAKGLSLGLARSATSLGSMFGPLLAGILIGVFGYDGGFLAMGLISLGVLLLVWYGLARGEV